MKKQLFPLLFAILLPASIMAQSFVNLSFTGRGADNKRIQLDRVVITNLTRNWQETLYWPDTTLTMQSGTGIYDIETMCTSSLQLFPNNPNPFNGITDVLLTVADAGTVTMEIADVNGRIVVGANDYSPLPGHHQFHITLSAAGTYVMTARQNGKTSSIKMMNNGGGNGDGIEYAGIVETMCTSSLQPKSRTRGNTTNPFNIGDQMEYAGYATINGEEWESQPITQTQETSQIFVLQFDVVSLDGQPCPGTPTLTDVDGNVYNTVYIGSQCWMKENLRTTHYANNMSIPAGTTYSYTEPYRYAPHNDESNVFTYGYLYNWKAVMQNEISSNSNPSGVQGICPYGWHVPSDAEWAQLTDYVSSRSEYVCGSNISYIAKALADTTGWQDYDGECVVGNNNLTAYNATNFSALPAGLSSSFYYCFGMDAFFWSTTRYENDGDNAYIRTLRYDHADVYRDYDKKDRGCSVRCVRD